MSVPASPLSRSGPGPPSSRSIRASAAQDIGARPTTEAVSAVPADERGLSAEEEVVAGSPLERIDARTARGDVVAGTASRSSPPPAPDRTSSSAPASKASSPGPPRRSSRTVAAGQAVVARRVVAADELIISGPAVDRVVAGAAVEDVRRWGSPPACRRWRRR